MADRFPSLDDFDAGQTTTSAPSSSTQPSDFLARERAALGDDADIFTSSNEPHNTATVAEDDDDDDDLLGGGMGGSSVPTNNNGGMGEDMMGDFESSFPAVDTQNERVAPGGTITGSGALPYRGATHPDQASSNTNGYSDDTSEPDVVKEWRERRDLAIQHRDEVSEGRKRETIKAAQEAVDEFYENYNNKRDKSVAATRKEAEEFLKSREDTTSGGTSWERIAKLVDLTGKGSSGGAAGTGKAKMREMLLDLRKDEKAPGATGY
ncbi:Clathrin light chain [Elasticomyces elasticus]|nr:Clathrin light chain [Elasticomyces elasticus]KAK3650441.1 Clathrin light chain [Elasticomyces elasticus]KAK4921825.1 Clathrin light chain [Elasticomyces elasticus]KAK5753433.1 Clathrin light chain [Elasticomyces elasticus]